MNYRLTIQYDGTDFHGWQVQAMGLRTVQGELQRALLVLECKETIVHGAGRTDAGVHAIAQVANVNLGREFASGKLLSALNGNLPPDVRVIEVERVGDDFHARFSARGKSYIYRIFNAPFRSPLWGRYAHWNARPLDLERMRRAAALFLGAHDWTPFSSAQTDVTGSRVRTVMQLEIEERLVEHGRLITISISADGFLRYMVRSIAGTLIAVGLGAIDERQIIWALETLDRTLAGATAPACGLTLARVHYEKP